MGEILIIDTSNDNIPAEVDPANGAVVRKPHQSAFLVADNYQIIRQSNRLDIASYIGLQILQ